MKIEFEIPDDTVDKLNNWINWMLNAYLNYFSEEKDIDKLIIALFKLKESLDKINDKGLK